MVLKNDYYDIAYNDLLYLQHKLDQPNYNPVSANAQQVAEKLLKSVLELISHNSAESFKTHNLRKINDCLLDNGVDLLLDENSLGFLKDFYFDTKYPGDNFVTVSKDKCNKCLSIMYDVIEHVNNFRRTNGLSTFSFEEKYIVEAKTSDLEKDVLMYCYRSDDARRAAEIVKDLAEQCPEVYYDEYTTDLERAWKTLSILGEIQNKE